MAKGSGLSQTKVWKQYIQAQDSRPRRRSLARQDVPAEPPFDLRAEDCVEAQHLMAWE